MEKRQIVGLIGNELKRRVIRLGLPISTVGSHYDRLPLRAPALVVGRETGPLNSRMGDLCINELIRGFYKPSQPPSADAIIAAWSKACELALNTTTLPSRIAEALNEALPEIPFYCQTGKDPRHMLAQFLVAASWLHGSFRPTSNVYSLALGKVTLRIDQQSLEWPGNRRRLKQPLPLPLNQAVREPLGKLKWARPATATLFSYLFESLEDFQHLLRPIFSMAVHGEAENALLDLFDVQYTRDDEYGDDKLIRMAESIVRKATSDPALKIIDLLGDMFDQDEVRSLLGRYRIYSPRARERQLSALNVLRAKMTWKKEDSSPSSVSELLALQQLVRGQ